MLTAASNDVSINILIVEHEKKNVENILSLSWLL